MKMKMKIISAAVLAALAHGAGAVQQFVTLATTDTTEVSTSSALVSPPDGIGTEIYLRFWLGTPGRPLVTPINLSSFDTTPGALISFRTQVGFENEAPTQEGSPSEGVSQFGTRNTTWLGTRITQIGYKNTAQSMVDAPAWDGSDTPIAERYAADSVQLGSNNFSAGGSNIQIGSNTRAMYANGLVLIGNRTLALYSNDSIVSGTEAHAMSAAYSVVQGAGARAQDGQFITALGSQTYGVGTGATVLGAQATAVSQDGTELALAPVSIGALSWNIAAGTVSFGGGPLADGTTATRELTNISAATTYTSAVNLGQMNANLSPLASDLFEVTTTVTGHTASIGTLQTGVTDLTSTVTGHTSAITALQTSMTGATGSIGTLQTQLTALTATVSAGVGSASAADLAALQALVTSQGNRLTAQEALTASSAAVATVTTLATQAQTTADSAVAASGVTAGRVDGLVTRADANDVKNVAQDQAIAVAKATADSAVAANAVTAGRVDGLVIRANANDVKNAAQDQAISAAQTTATQAQTTADSAVAANTVTAGRVDTLTTRADANDVKNVAQDQAISAAQTTATSAYSMADQARTGLATTNATVAAQGQRIAAVEAGVAGLERKLTDLDKRLSAGVSMAMAMASASGGQLTAAKPSAVGVATGIYNGATSLSASYSRLIPIGDDGAAVVVRGSIAAGSGGVGISVGMNYAF